MYPYNPALNRSIRRNKNSFKMEQSTKSQHKKEGSMPEESEILWDPAEYKLTHVLDNFKLPQIVRVVEGFMFTEDDSLASGTVLTIHGEQRIEQILAVDRNQTGIEIYIPLSCPYKATVTVPDREKIYRTVKDLCNATPLPKCVIVHEKISVSGVKIPSGRWLIVKSISKNRNDEAVGISVELMDDKVTNIVLPLKTVGNFAPCPLPADQGRSYFIRDLASRTFPLWIKFQAAEEITASFGPQTSVVKLIKLQTANVVYATSVIGGMKFAISFSRDLPVTIEVARGMLDQSATYARKVKVAAEQVDIDVLSHLTETNPYSSMYQSAVYADIRARRQTMIQKDLLKCRSECSSESIPSDLSFNEDSRSQNEPRYIVDKSVAANGSVSVYHTADTLSNSSVSSVESGEQRDQQDKKPYSVPYNQPPVYEVMKGYVLGRQQIPDNEDAGLTKSQEDNDYVEILESMDSPFPRVKQRSTRGVAMPSSPVQPFVQPYKICELNKTGTNQTGKQGSPLTEKHTYLRPVPTPPQTIRNIVKPPRRERKTKSESAFASTRTVSPSKQLSRSSSEDSTSTGSASHTTLVPIGSASHTTLVPVGSASHTTLADSSTSEVIYSHIPETLDYRCNEKDSVHKDDQKSEVVSVKSDDGSTKSDDGSAKSGSTVDAKSDNSIKSDESVSSDYKSVRSDCSTSSVDSLSGQKERHGENVGEKKQRPKKPPRKKGPPKPLARSTSLKSIEVDTEILQDIVKPTLEEGFSTTSTSTISTSEVDSFRERKKESEKLERGEDEIKTESKVDTNDNLLAENISKNMHEPSNEVMTAVTTGEAKSDASREETTASHANTPRDDDVFEHEAETFDDLATAKEEIPVIGRKFSVVEESEEGVCKILDALKLSQFKEIFQNEQINGALLDTLNAETLVDLGLDKFQATKLLAYIRGWRPDESEATGEDEPIFWTVNDVIANMELINLKTLAVFCHENQVDGKLLEIVIDEGALECLRTDYDIKLRKLEEMKLTKFVKTGWRPDSTLKKS